MSVSIIHGAAKLLRLVDALAPNLPLLFCWGNVQQGLEGLLVPLEPEHDPQVEVQPILLRFLQLRPVAHKRGWGIFYREAVVLRIAQMTRILLHVYIWYIYGIW